MEPLAGGELSPACRNGSAGREAEPLLTMTACFVE